MLCIILKQKYSKTEILHIKSSLHNIDDYYEKI